MAKESKEKKVVIELRYDEDKLNNEITVDELIEYDEGSLRAAKNIIGRFVWDPENDCYMELEAARKLIGSMSVNQLIEYSDKFMALQKAGVGADPKQ